MGECAYANTVEGASTPTWCVATTSAYTYKSGVTMSSTAAARRAAKVTFVLKVKSSVKTTSQLQTLVASGSTAAAFATALTAVNTASNYTAPRYSHCCYSNVYRRQQQCIHTLAIDALLGGCHLCGRSPVSSNTQCGVFRVALPHRNPFR